MPPAAFRAPVLLSARVSLIRLWSSMSPPSFPRTCPCSGAPFPPQGPSGWFPRFVSTTKHSAFLPPFPRRFVSFAARYRRRALGFVPAAARRHSCGPGVVHRHPQTGLIDGGDRTSQVPGGPHSERALLFDPGGTFALGHCRASGVVFRQMDGVDSHDSQTFRGSITRPAHSLSTLRRVGCPAATQDSLPGGWPAFSGRE
jgi:hypothetical protein